MPPPASQKLILFDIDGTLCSASALSIDAYFSCISMLLGREITLTNSPVELYGVTDKSLLAAILVHHGVPAADIPDQSARFFKAHPGFLEGSVARGLHSEAIPGAVEALDWLAGKANRTNPRLRLGLLTGNYPASAAFKLKAARVDPARFDPKISSYGDNADDRHQLVANALGAWRKVEGGENGESLRVEDVLLIGDTPLDVQSAVRAGCKMLAVSTGAYGTETLRSFEPDMVCERLDTKEVRIFLDEFLGGKGRDGKII